MRRAVLTLSGTVAGLAALFSFKTHVPGITPVAAPSTPAGLSVSAPPTPSSASASASASPSKTAKKTAPKVSSSPTTPATTPAMTQPTTPVEPATTPAKTTPTTAPSKTKAPPSPAPTKSSAPAAPSGTFTGPDESTNYGPVQVQLTVSDGKITAATDVQQPQDSIGANAVSQLNSEVLTAQSASVQAVSGATYTSNGYIASLQAAVDQAGL
ncbi:MAG TPA: FMN-binding protein [Trebonia sp.]|jgi:uncharacterized protein with FMN-binding domain